MKKGKNKSCETCGHMEKINKYASPPLVRCGARREQLPCVSKCRLWITREGKDEKTIRWFVWG